MNIDYYKILGVAPTAEAGDIKKAYRQLAMKYHPDLNPDNKIYEEQFKLIVEAYDVLKDRDKRNAYDLLGETAAREKEAAERIYEPSVFDPQDEEVRDFLQGFYAGHDSSLTNERHGEDVRYNLKINFEEAALGVEKNIRIPIKVVCPLCHGSGVRPGARMVRCTQCRGKGRVKARLGIYKPCSNCGGSGAVITDYCLRCHGDGHVLSNRIITVHVPPGIEAGTRLCISGMGAKGKRGGRPGDFFVVVHVKKHKLFTVDGKNILCTVPVPFFTALLGGSIDVPTIEGTASVTLPAGTLPGKMIRLRGKGGRLPENNKRGDIIVTVQIEIPKKLSRSERKLLKEFEKSCSLEQYPLTNKYRKNLEQL
ncbi:molecular chaperone DnaJ [Thermodesulfobacteriota bacterium]